MATIRQQAPLRFSRYLAVFTLACILFVGVVLAIPASNASASTPTFTAVAHDVTADVQLDGSVHVIEKREFKFTKRVKGIYWMLPKGINKNTNRPINVENLKITKIDRKLGTEQLFSRNSSHASGSYEVIDEGSHDKLKFYMPQSYDDDIVLQLDYTLTNLVTRWADSAELYWKYLSDGWTGGTENVSASLSFDGFKSQTVAQDRIAAKSLFDYGIRAWGHGPLDGSIKFNQDQLVFTNPGVGESEFAEMRVLFPTDWVPQASKAAGNIDRIAFNEESRWADEANQIRDKARDHKMKKEHYDQLINMVMVLSAFVVWILLLVSIGLFFVKNSKQKKARNEARGGSKYFRDVPTKDHPMVLAALWDLHGKLNSTYSGASKNALSAGLLNLCDKGYIRLEVLQESQQEQQRGVLGSLSSMMSKVSKSNQSEYQIRCLLDEKQLHELIVDQKIASINTAQQNADIDLHLLRYLYLEQGITKDATMNFDQLSKYMSDLDKDEQKKIGDGFKDAVASPLGTSFITKYKSSKIVDFGGSLRIILYLSLALSLFSTCAGVVLALLAEDGDSLGMALCGNLILFVLPLFIMLCMLSRFPKMTEKAFEVYAQLEGLRNWLNDFTHLSEAVPRDVILWNRLLVMATAFGIADRVVADLERYLPEIIESPDFWPVYGWYGYHLSTGYSILGEGSTVLTHTTSLSALASSDYSSAGGFGGGFSGGGGGGFGGGGGGGSF